MLLFISIVMLQQLHTDAGGFDRFQASLLNVILFLFPLFILTIGAMSVAGDVESGWYQLIRTYPVSIGLYIRSKYIALVGTFLFALFVTEAVLLIIGSFFGGVHIDVRFFVFTVAIVFIFSSISIAIGALSIHRLQALGYSLGVWAIVTLIGNYIVMAIGTVIPKHVYEQLIRLHVHLNTVEWFRYVYLLQIGETGMLGKSFYYLTKFYETPAGIVVCIGITILWLALPIGLAYLLLKRKEKR